MMPCSNIYDGDWGTYGRSKYSESQLFVNYSKPVGATAESLWEVKNGVQDVEYTLPSDCFSQEPIRLQLQSHQMGGYGNGLCYNGTDWTQVFSDTAGQSSAMIYEDGMKWDIAEPPTTTTTQSGLASSMTGLGSGAGNIFSNISLPITVLLILMGVASAIGIFFVGVSKKVAEG